MYFPYQIGKSAKSSMVRLWYVWDHWHFASIVRLAENLKRSWQEVHREATGFPRFLRFPENSRTPVVLSFLFVRQLLGLHWRNKRTMRKLEKTFLHNLFLMTGTSTYVIERHMKSWNDMKTRKRQRKACHIFQDNFGAISLILHCLWFCRKAPQTPPQLETFCIACLSQTWLTLWGLMRGSAQPVYNGLLVYHCLPFKPFNAQAKNESRLKKKTEAETLAIGVRKGWKRYEERNTTQGHDRPCLLCIHLWSSMLWYLHWSGWCSPENGTKEYEIQGDCGHSKIPGGEAEKEAAVEQVSGRPVARGVAFGFERTCLGCRGTRDTSWRFMSWVMRHSAVQPCKKHQKTTCRRPTSMWLGQNRLFDFVCLALELGIVFFFCGEMRAASSC